MSKLYNTSQVKTGTTHNGAVTNLSSLNPCVDLFFLAGASRGKDISTVFHKSLDEDPEITGRMLLWMRDILSGAGEREQFRRLFKKLIYSDIALAERVLRKIPYTGIGRWDDVFVAFGTPLQDVAVEMCVTALNNKDALCAKWMPRRKKDKNKNSNLRILVNAFTEGNISYDIKEKLFRKHVAEISSTVEQKMCAGKWDEINFSHVPSKASQKLSKAFWRNAEERYKEYLDKLVKGDKTVKVNAKAVHPHEILKTICSRTWGGLRISNNKEALALAEAQWKALPDFVGGTKEKVIPMVDVSGSMNGLPIEVATSLGIYFAQRNSGEFAGEIITFTDKPRFVKIPQGLKAGAEAIFNSPVGYNTDIQEAFKLICSTAIRGGLSQEDIPTKLLILSDMEFDNSCIRGTSVSAFDKARVMFEKAGYKVPQIIFWNINGRQGNSPVTVHDTGTALVSGFSPSILTAIMKGADDFTPVNIMLNKLMDERYNL